MESQKNKSGYIWVLVVVVLAFFAYSMWKPSPGSEQVARDIVESVKPLDNTGMEGDSPATGTQLEGTDTGKTGPADTMMVDDPATVKEFIVNAENFKYDITEIKVKKGDTVRIVFTNKAGFHDWVLDEFSAKTAQLAAGKSETVTFVADEAGTFEYYCSVGQHRAMGMVGKLIVE